MGSMTSTERIEELASAYSLAVLDEADMKELEDFLKNNPEEYESIIKQNEEAFSHLIYALKGETPNTSISKELLSETEVETISNKQISFSDRFKSGWLLAISAFATVFILAIIAFSLS